MKKAVKKLRLKLSNKAKKSANKRLLIKKGKTLSK